MCRTRSIREKILKLYFPGTNLTNTVFNNHMYLCVCHMFSTYRSTFLYTVQSDIFQPQTSVTIEPGSGEAEVTILPIVDERYEADQESLTVRIVSVTGGNIDEERQEAIVNILDNDG